MEDKYLITIDKELIHEYHQHYLKIHPTCRSLPFAKKETVKEFNKDGSPKLTKGGKQKTKKQAINKKDYTIDDCLYGVLSLNELLVIQNRMTMNGKKEQWGDLGIWIADKYNLTDLQMSNAIIEYRIFGETKANRDCDNISGGVKFLGDGLYVKSKAFIDDNYNYINPIIISCCYDKEKPRTEIRISLFDNKIKDIYEKMAVHIKNFK